MRSNSTNNRSDERHLSIRTAVMAFLEKRPASALEISAAVGVSEHDVIDHLEHIAKTLRAQGRRLEVQPAVCLECAFVFRKRDRLSTPGRCPICASGRITPPVFAIPA